MTKKQYKTPKVRVGTVKKSIAPIASRWLRRKASQRRGDFPDQNVEGLGTSSRKT
jgi:hypothetical protein